jgi:hypothetical protein
MKSYQTGYLYSRRKFKIELASQKTLLKKTNQINLAHIKIVAYLTLVKCGVESFAHFSAT